MTSRRAISPVIATVILIAVAVALGIAVAVWAGALTGNLQNQEKLIVTGYMPTDGILTLSITNQSPKSVTVTSISFNNAPQTIPPAFVSMASGVASSQNITLTAAGSPGISYPVTVATASGGSYPVTVTAP